MLRSSVASLAPPRTGFETRSAHVRFVLDKVALGQVFLPVLRFTPVSIIPSLLHSHLHLHVSAAKRKSGLSLRSFLKTMNRELLALSIQSAN